MNRYLYLISILVLPIFYKCGSKGFDSIPIVPDASQKEDQGERSEEDDTDTSNQEDGFGKISTLKGSSGSCPMAYGSLFQMASQPNFDVLRSE